MPVSAFVASATHPESPVSNTWVSLSLTFQGLKALGVRQDSLDSFPVEFQQGMAARAKVLGDTGENSPENWEKPLGTPEVHVVITAISPNQVHLASALERARQAYKQLPGITAIWRQDVHVMRKRNRLAFGTVSAIPPSKVAAFPAPTRTSNPSRRAILSLAIPTRWGHKPRGAPGNSGPQRQLCCVPQTAPAGGGVPQISQVHLLLQRGRRANRSEDDGALA